MECFSGDVNRMRYGVGDRVWCWIGLGWVMGIGGGDVKL